MKEAIPEGRSLKELVRKGWNSRSYLYRPDARGSDRLGHTAREYRSWLAPLMGSLPYGASVLELGCGIGVPATRLLARHFHVIGVDIADLQIARARKLVPNAHFLRADMTRVRFRSASFEAVVALYSIIHVPLQEQRRLFGRVYSWLAPGGVFLSILGAERWRGVESGWLGSTTPMFWDQVDADTYERWLTSCGFLLEEKRFVPEGEGGHELFRLKKPELNLPPSRTRRPSGGGKKPSN